MGPVPQNTDDLDRRPVLEIRAANDPIQRITVPVDQIRVRDTRQRGERRPNIDQPGMLIDIAVPAHPSATEDKRCPPTSGKKCRGA